MSLCGIILRAPQAPSPDIRRFILDVVVRHGT